MRPKQLLHAGVAHALEHRYLKTLVFGISKDLACNRLMEVRAGQPPASSLTLLQPQTELPSCAREYVFGFKYSAEGEVTMTMSQGQVPLSQVRRPHQVPAQPHLD